MTDTENGADRSKMSHIERLEHNLFLFRNALDSPNVNVRESAIVLMSYLQEIKDANDRRLIADRSAGYIREQIEKLKQHKLFPELEKGLETVFSIREGLRDIFEGKIGLNPPEKPDTKDEKES